MKVAKYRVTVIAFLLFLTFPVLLLASQAKVGDVESYGELNRDRVVRIRSVEGDVVLKTGRDGEWIQAHDYMILTAGYVIVSGPGGFAEIELEPRRYVRLRENTEVALLEVSSKAVFFRYTSGGVYVSALAGYARRLTFEVGPMRQVNQYDAGAFRIDGESGGEKTVSVREGMVSIEHEGGVLDVYEGNMARLNSSISYETAYGRDSWDVYVERRDNEILALGDEPTIYEEIPGRYEFYGYSEWVAYPSYGYFWWPHLSLVFIGHHHYGHHIHDGIGFGVHIRDRHRGGFRHFKGRHLHKKKLLHRNRHLLGKGHLHKRKHLPGGGHKTHIRRDDRGLLKSRIFRRGSGKRESHIFKRGDRTRSWRSRVGGNGNKWRSDHKVRSFSRGKSFGGRAFRNGIGRSMRRGGGGFRGGRAKR